jgi:beta-phosphoglucomutase family hydrolase
VAAFRYRPRVLGLSHETRACLFDLDGVLTQTASVHAAAWEEMLDEFLRRRAGEREESFVPFDAVDDYEEYVDGKPRYEGVASFLASRGKRLADGSPTDAPEAETVHGLGDRKNEIMLAMIRRDGVEPYQGSVEYVRAARAAALRTAVVSSSSNCRDVLAAAGIEELFEAVIDGVLAERERLRGEPAPDTYLAGARELGVEPGAAAVFEDALAGVEAGRAGRFGTVVGADRLGHADALRDHGADFVVSDLAELLRAR